MLTQVDSDIFRGLGVKEFHPPPENLTFLDFFGLFFHFFVL